VSKVLTFVSLLLFGAVFWLTAFAVVGVLRPH
jgi:hypothetical protein